MGIGMEWSGVRDERVVFGDGSIYESGSRKGI